MKIIVAVAALTRTEPTFIMTGSSLTFIQKNMFTSEPERCISWMILSADISLSKLYLFRSVLAYTPIRHNIVTTDR